jgi:hypothetical protein
MFSSEKTISPDVLISLINEEADRQKVQKGRRSNDGGKGKADEKDEALFVGNASGSRGGPSRGRGRGGRGSWRGRGGKPSSSVECWNCGEKGHIKPNCPHPKKEHSPTATKTGSANVAAESDSDGDGVWAVDADSDSDGSLPALDELSDSDDDEDVASSFDGESESDGSFFGEEDWFSEPEEVSGGIDADKEGKTYDSESQDNHSTSEEAHAATEPLKLGQYSFVQAELYDSGCTRHISPYREDFESFTEIPPISFSAANKAKFTASGKGEMVIGIPNGVEVSQLRLTEVLYSPEVGYTLVSIGRLDKKGFSATFGDGKCTIRGPDDEYIGKILKNKRGLYKVEHQLDIEEANAVEETLTLEQLHRRMGHISPVIARKLVEKNFVTGVRLEATSSGDPFFCESCVYAKATRKAIPKAREGERADVFAGEVHSDLWGPAPVETKGKKRYYITFTDDKTRLTNIYLLAKKNDAFDSYKDYEAWCQTQLNVPVKILHSDRGGEYLGKEFILHLNSRGTTQKLTVHDTPQHNGVAERRNRTILERVRALLHSTGLPRTLWGEAARHVVWLMNRTSTKAVEGMTPYEAAFGRRPDLSEVRDWGERVWVRVEGGDKLGGRVREGRWMGLDGKSKGVRIYWPDTRTVGIERNVYVDKTGASASRLEGEEWDGFGETNADAPIIPQNPSNVSQDPVNPQKSAPFQAPHDDPTPNNEIPSETDEIPSEPDERPKRTRKPTERIRDLISGKAVSDNRPKLGRKIAAGIQLPTEVPQLVDPEPAPVNREEVDAGKFGMAADFVDEYCMIAEMSESEALEPRDLKEARSRPDWLMWEKAIHEELAVLKAAGTWELVDAPAVVLPRLSQLVIWLAQPWLCQPSVAEAVNPASSGFQPAVVWLKLSTSRTKFNQHKYHHFKKDIFGRTTAFMSFNNVVGIR